MRISVAVVLVAFAFGACHKGDDGSTAAKRDTAPPLVVKTVVAKLGDAPDVLVLTGTVIAHQRAELTADTQGKVLNVFVERGDPVKLGQALVQLDMRTAAMSAREAQANLSAARAQKELADQECVRTKTLFEKGAITASEYDRQMTSCRAALEQLAATQARTEMMVKSVSDGLVRAPFAGTVDMKNVSLGEWVAPGKPLFTLVEKDPLRVELSVPELAVGDIHDGARVFVEAVAQPGKRFGAKITRIGAEIGRTRSLIVEATLDPGSGLVPGMFAEAHVVTKIEQRVVVPKAAVVHRGKRDHVFVVANGEVVDTIVHVGYPPGEGQATILGGVAAGEKLVVEVIPPPPAAGAGSAGSGSAKAPPKDPWDLLGDGTKVTE
jgi:membrane fusion protein (multidrug efflux system)